VQGFKSAYVRSLRLRVPVTLFFWGGIKSRDKDTWIPYPWEDARRQSKEPCLPGPTSSMLLRPKLQYPGRRSITFHSLADFFKSVVLSDFLSGGRDPIFYVLVIDNIKHTQNTVLVAL
jgi:hypothetical protein